MLDRSVTVSFKMVLIVFISLDLKNEAFLESWSLTQVSNVYIFFSPWRLKDGVMVICLLVGHEEVQLDPSVPIGQ